jgi:hypothetical protein
MGKISQPVNKTPITILKTATAFQARINIYKVCRCYVANGPLAIKRAEERFPPQQVCSHTR